MIGYTVVGTNDFDRARGFYDALFDIVGVSQLFASDRMVMWSPSMEVPGFSIAKPADGQPATIGNGTMVAVAIDDRKKVDAVHAKALALGGQDEGAPGIRGEDPDGFYGAYFRDLDGNKICAFKMGPA